MASKRKSKSKNKQKNKPTKNQTSGGQHNDHVEGSKSTYDKSLIVHNNVSDLLGFGKIADSKPAQKFCNAMSGFLFTKKTFKEHSASQPLSLTSEQANVLNRMIAFESSKDRNIFNILSIVSEMTHDNIPDDVLDEDWAVAFYSHGREVYSKDLHKIWAKVLTREASKPGSISRQLLGTLKNLSKEQAITFSKLCQFTLGSDVQPHTLIIPYFDDVTFSSQFDDYFEAQELITTGLISTRNDKAYWMKPNHEGNHIHIFHDQFCMITLDTNIISHPPEVVPIGSFRLTSTGRELAAIVKRNLSIPFTNHVIQYFESEGFRVQVTYK